MVREQFSCKLSNEVDKDLEEIYDYSADKFGIEQAIKYLDGFKYLFENLSKNPQLGRWRNEITKDLRSISYESHTIFYMIMPDHILIVRILYGSRDITKFLLPEA